MRPGELKAEAAFALALMTYWRRPRTKRPPPTDEERISDCEYWACRDNREHWQGLNRPLGRNGRCSCGSGLKVKRCHG